MPRGDEIRERYRGDCAVLRVRRRLVAGHGRELGRRLRDVCGPVIEDAGS